MSDTLKVVELRPGKPSLRDIAAWLRIKADQIEACETSEIETLLILTKDTEGELHSTCFGDNPNRAEVVGLFYMAALKSATGNWE